MKKMTIGEVARQAGVSKSTISRYLNGNFQKMSPTTREIIRRTIQELDYHPNRQAQTLKTKKSGLIGFVIADMANLYSARLISGASRVARQSNYQVLTMDSSNSRQLEQDSLLKLRDQSLEGLIIQPMSRSSDDYQEVITGIPTVFVDRVTDMNHWPGVVVDNYRATRKIGELIVKRGYQKVLMVSEPIEVSQARLDRLNGIKQVTLDHHLEFELVELVNLVGETTRNRLKSKITQSVTTGVATAVFASNSRIMMLILQLITECGYSIPRDIGLCGYDDWQWTALTQPPLTSIEQDTLSVGVEAMTTLIDHINDDHQKNQIKVIDSKINIRESI